jgi:hypothetical protein
MLRFGVVVGFVVLACGLLVSPGISGGDKKETTGKAKGTLPTYWKKLGLTDEQKQKIYTTRASFAAKIGALRDQIDKLQKQEAAELQAFLTDEQKAALKRIYAEKAGTKEAPTEKKKTEPKQDK